MLFLYTVLVTCGAVLLTAGVIEQRRHFANLEHVPTRVLINGIRGKSSITRLCAGALRGGDVTTVAKTTGTAARFIHPDATEEPVYRKFGIANVVEQIGIVRRAAAYNPDALVIECMAVMPALQEINQSKLIRSTIGVLCNVREDHLEEMGPTLDDVARSLSRSMPEGGICVTAEQDRFAVLQEEAEARDCQLVYADPESVTDDELRGFSWFTFKENVAIALTVAELLGVDRRTALQGMYDAPPDPGVLSVERYATPEGKRLRFANVFAANDPESTLMNINQLLDLGAIQRPLNVVINCRPDRVERNGQMGELIPDLKPDKVFVIGHPVKSAVDAIPAEWRSGVVDLGGDRRDPEELVTQLLDGLGPDSSLVTIGNIHGQGELLLEHLAALPADEEPDAEPVRPAADDTGGEPADPAQTMPLYAPHLDPYQEYPEPYEAHHLRRRPDRPREPVAAQPAGREDGAREPWPTVTPQAPHVPQAPQTVQAPHVPQALQALQAPHVPEAREAREAPHVPEAPEAPHVPQQRGLFEPFRSPAVPGADPAPQSDQHPQHGQSPGEHR